MKFKMSLDLRTLLSLNVDVLLTYLICPISKLQWLSYFRLGCGRCSGKGIYQIGPLVEGKLFQLFSGYHQNSSLRLVLFVFRLSRDLEMGQRLVLVYFTLQRHS